MTFYFPTGATSFTFSVNLPNLQDLGAGNFYYLGVRSRYSDNIWGWFIDVVETNDRYTKFSLTISEQEREGHYNGIYNYDIQTVIDGEQTVLEEGLLKWINEEGGSMNTVSYISDNETRDAHQYYRPNY